MSRSALFVGKRKPVSFRLRQNTMEDMEVLLKGHVSGRRGGILRYQPELRTESFLSRWDLTGFHGRGNDMGTCAHSLRSKRKEKKKNEDEYLEF